MAIYTVCAFAAAGVAPGAQPLKSTADPQTLVVELTAELQLAYRDNVPEFEHRSEQLKQAFAAWNASAKSGADRAQMTAWLHKAIQASLPGSPNPLPPTPAFAEIAIAAEIKSDQSSSTNSLPIAKQNDLQSLIVNSPRRISVTQSVTSPTVDQPPTAEPHSLSATKEPSASLPMTSEVAPAGNDADPFRDDGPPGHANGDDPAGPANSAPGLSPISRESTGDSVHVRLDELAPRIQGFEMTLRGMDAKLIAGKLTTTELAKLSAKLAELDNERQFLALYVGALSSAEQQQVPALRSLEPTTRLLIQGIADRQAKLQQDGVDGTDSKRSQELAILDRLATELKQSSAAHAAAK